MIFSVCAAHPKQSSHILSTIALTRIIATFENDLVFACLCAQRCTMKTSVLLSRLIWLETVNSLMMDAWMRCNIKSFWLFNKSFTSKRENDKILIANALKFECFPSSRTVFYRKFQFQSSLALNKGSQDEGEAISQVMSSFKLDCSLRNRFRTSFTIRLNRKCGLFPYESLFSY